jgi:ferrochelatase
MNQEYDAILILSFGGPEGRDEVMPFLENVLRGRNVPRERMLEVAEHYQHFDGVSPINQQCRALISALQDEFADHALELPIYWGNRNWHPMLGGTLRQMKEDGVQRALAFVTSVFNSYSGCRQYLEDIEKAQAEVGDGAPQVDKLRSFYNHPGFVGAMQGRLEAALDKIPDERRDATQIVFTAHSIPSAMAGGCDYEKQLNESCRLVMEKFHAHRSQLVYQSRSGPPSQPWLEPDVCDYLRELQTNDNVTDVVLVPIGFISDHMEVLFDLDTEAKALCDELGLNMLRAETVGTHLQFISMIRELILERTADAQKKCMGTFGASDDKCPADCCPSGRPAHSTNP